MFLRALRAMRAHQAVLLTPSMSLRPPQLPSSQAERTRRTPILRTFFQVPYLASLLFATAMKIAYAAFVTTENCCTAQSRINGLKVSWGVTASAGKSTRTFVANETSSEERTLSSSPIQNGPLPESQAVPPPSRELAPPGIWSDNPRASGLRGRGWLFR